MYAEGIMAKKAIVLLAEGFEEVEALTPVDYLRRAGIEVTVTSTGAGGKNPAVKGSHGIEVNADAALDSLLREGKLSPSEWDGVIVPGGLPGADNLAASKEAGAFISEMAGAGKWVCAICAAPARVLSPLGLLGGRKFTCFPGDEEKVLVPGSSSAGAEWKKDRVVVDGNFITSRGAGTAGEFACAIIGKLVNEGAAKKLAERVLLASASA
jgi:4-methyl-5(b-hydroxyethyl)-thiazole monophosphate biosynthesis